jgi:hypothetical protein
MLDLGKPGFSRTVHLSKPQLKQFSHNRATRSGRVIFCYLLEEQTTQKAPYTNGWRGLSSKLLTANWKLKDLDQSTAGIE